MPHRPTGTHPDVPDHRDHEYAAPRGLRLPRMVDLREEFPPVYNQGKLNSCSANAIGAAVWLDELREHGHRGIAPSRLFIYYNERVKEGVTHCNRPVSLRDGYRSVGRAGFCSEHLWPYRFDRFDTKPPASCYRAARRHRVIRYSRIRRELRPLRACLAEGFPFTFGASVFQSFKSARVAKTGAVPLPKRGEKPLGGHAMLVVGYDDDAERFIVRNSWGRAWGHRGYCFMPYEMFLNPATTWDFWTARRLTGRR